MKRLLVLVLLVGSLFAVENVLANPKCCRTNNGSPPPKWFYNYALNKPCSFPAQEVWIENCGGPKTLICCHDGDKHVFKSLDACAPDNITETAKCSSDPSSDAEVCCYFHVEPDEGETDPRKKNPAPRRGILTMSLEDCFLNEGKVIKGSACVAPAVPETTTPVTPN